MMVDGAGTPATGGHKIVAGQQQESKGKCCWFLVNYLHYYQNKLKKLITNK